MPLTMTGLKTLSSKCPFEPPTVTATWFPITCPAGESFVVRWEQKQSEQVKHARRRTTPTKTNLPSPPAAFFSLSSRYHSRWKNQVTAVQRGRKKTFGSEFSVPSSKAQVQHSPTQPILRGNHLEPILPNPAAFLKALTIPPQHSSI